MHIVNPRDAIKLLFETNNDYSEAAGYKINIQKYAESV